MARKKKKTNKNLKVLRNIIQSAEFDSLNDDLKKIVLNILKSISSEEAKKGTGIIGKLLGNHSKKIALYIAFIIAVFLIIVGLIYIFLPPEYKQTTNLEFWQLIGPIVYSTLGYIFGACTKK